MSFRRELGNGITIVSTQAEHATQLEELQNIVFPTLAESERLKAVHYLKHIELFPEGQFVALDADRVVGMTTTIRLSDKTVSEAHTFPEIIQGGYCTSHEPQGEWMYGIDMGTHPDSRGKGIAKALYGARQETVKKLGLRGQYTVGMMSGYGQYANTLSGEEYYKKLLAGEIVDPTVTTQMKVGFEPAGLVPEYLDDPICGNYGVRLILPATKVFS